MGGLSLLIKPVSACCDMACSYCFYKDVAGQRDLGDRGRMSLEVMEDIVRRAFAAGSDSLSIAFQGGEPSLAGAEFYRQTIKLIERYNTDDIPVDLSIQTNGCSLDRKLMGVFRENGFLVGVSFDGTPELHDNLRKDRQGRGTARRVMKNLRLMRSMGIDTVTTCVVTAPVARKAKDVFHFLAPLGPMQFVPCISPFQGQGQEYELDPQLYGSFLIETFQLYFQAYLKGRYTSVRSFDNYVDMLLGQPPENCGMGGRCGRYYVIEADGSVYPCDFYALDSWYLGSIRDSSFRRLEKSPAGQLFRDSSARLCVQCHDCQWRTLCRGGCRRDRPILEDGSMGPSKWCSSYKAFFESAIDGLRFIADQIVEDELWRR